MKKITLVFAMMMAFCSVFAQDNSEARSVGLDNDKARTAAIESVNATTDSAKNWKVTGILSFNVGATGLVNWAAGGNNTINLLAGANVSFLYHKNNIAWDSNIDTEFGEAYVENAQYNHNWQKTNDKLNISTKFGWEFHKNWYLTALGSFKTQYAYGYDYSQEVLSPISRIMSPSYTDMSVGIDWKYKTLLSIYLSPAAGRITSCLDENLRGNYLGDDYIEGGAKYGKNYRAEFGASFRATVLYDQVKNLKILSTVTLFTPYNKNFGNIDVDWDFSISYQFLKVLNVSLGTQLKYYDSVKFIGKTKGVTDEVPTQHVQFKAILGLGVGYSF